MIIARLLYSIGETQITEYPDVGSALADILANSNHDYANMTLMEIEEETGQFGRIYNGQDIANDLSSDSAE